MTGTGVGLNQQQKDFPVICFYKDCTDRFLKTAACSICANPAQGSDCSSIFPSGMCRCRLCNNTEEKVSTWGASFLDASAVPRHRPKD